MLCCLLPFLSALIAPFAKATPPTIAYPPVDRAVIPDQPAVFSVIAEGTSPLGYQWKKDGVPIKGSTSYQLSFSHAQLSDVGSYTVVVTNAEGSATSSNAALSVISPSAGALDYSFAWGGAISSWVDAVLVQPDGRILICGAFWNVSGAMRGAIARLNPDGTNDSSFMDGLSGSGAEILAMALQENGKIVIVGNFKSINGLSHNYVARLNANGSIDTAFQNGLPSTGYALRSVAIQSSGKIIVGGDGPNLARLNADGTKDTSFLIGSGPNQNVTSVVTQSDDKIVIAGTFTTFNGITRRGIARLNSDGSLDTSFQNGMSGIISPSGFPAPVLAQQSDGRTLVGGYFNFVNGVAQSNIARLNSDGSLDASFQSGVTGRSDGYSPPVKSFVPLDDGKMIIGGAFTSVFGVNRPGVARLNSDGTLDNSFLNWSFGANLRINSTAVQSDGKVLTGGGFVKAFNTSINSIARLNSDGTFDQSFQNGTVGINSYGGTAGLVGSMKEQADGRILIAGISFQTIHGVTRNSFARLNSNGSLDTSFLKGMSGASGNVWTFAEQPDGRIVIGGDFNMVNDVSRNKIARLNTDGSLDTGFLNGLAGANSRVASVKVQSDGKLVIGGFFTTFNGATRTAVARLNTDGSLDANFKPNLVDSSGAIVWSLAIQSDGKVVIGGQFTTIDGIARKNIARLNTDGSLDTSFLNGLSGASSWIRSLILQNDGKVVIGGNFANVNSQPRSGIARLNDDGSLDTNFQNGLSGADAQVHSVALQADGKVLIGGEFDKVNGVARGPVARLNANGSLDTSFQQAMNFQFLDVDWVETVSVQKDGHVLIGGSISKVHELPVDGFARLWGDANVRPIIKGLRLDGGGFALTWYSLLNVNYRLQYKSDLNDATWLNVLGDVLGTGREVMKNDPTAINAQRRFYRVIAP